MTSLLDDDSSVLNNGALNDIKVAHDERCLRHACILPDGMQGMTVYVVMSSYNDHWFRVVGVYTTHELALQAAVEHDRRYKYEITEIIPRQLDEEY